MPQFVIPASDAFRDAPAHTVSTRQNWADQWTARPGLYCQMTRWGSGSVRPEAELIWFYARVMLPGETSYTYRAPLDLLGHYVKIEIAQPAPADPLRWYGIITDDARQRGGGVQVFEDPDWVRKETGTQILSAEGLDLLLMREIVFTSYVRTAAGQRKKINRGLTFNMPNAAGDPANRSTQKLQGLIDGDYYAFAPDLWDAEPWSTKTILEYLLAFHPTEAAADLPLKWHLSDNAKLVCPDWDRPVVQTHGRDLRSIINQLCDRRKGICWQLLVRHEGPDPEILLDVFSFLPAPLELPSGLTQPANQEPIELGDDVLDLDSAVDVQASLRKSDHQRVDQVIVRGARKRVVASFSYGDDSLTSDWDFADETDYQNGPGGISGLNIAEQQRRVREFRARDRLERVYSWLRIATDWDGRVGGGETADKFPLSYCAPPDEETGEEESFHTPELRLERFLPKELTDAAPAGSPPTVRPLFGIIRTWGVRWQDELKYSYLDRLGACADIEDTGDGSGRDWSVSVQAQRDAPGVILKVKGGQHGGAQHLLAQTAFTPLAKLDKAGDLDWSDVIITAMFELDAQVEQRWPATAQLDAKPDMIRKVWIDLGDKARLDWVHAGAVLELDEEGRPIYTSGSYPLNGQYVRDDRTEMLDLARILFEWYSTPRQAFTFVMRQIAGIVNVGQLVTRIGSGATATDVNACVTGIEVDLLTVRMQVSTMLAELDPLEFVGRMES